MRVLIALLIAITLSVSTVNFATADNLIQKSILKLIHPGTGEGYCSGFVIDSKRHYVMTAEHCMRYWSFPIINDQQSGEVFHVPELDVAIVEAPAVAGLPALKPFKGVPRWDMPVVMYGFPMGMELEEIKSSVMIVDFTVGTIPGRWIMFYDEPKAGMSGGPILLNGRVLAVVQQGEIRAHLGISRKIEDIYEATKDYWQYGMDSE